MSTILGRMLSPRRNRAALRRLTRRFGADRKGLALVEFAMVLPIMLTTYFGVVEVAQGVMIDRKVTQLTRALADLTAQVTTVSTTDITEIFNSAQTIMLPFTDVAPSMAIVNIVIDPLGVARVCWSNQKNSTAPARGATIDVPADMRIPSTSLIMSRASYDFTPLIGYMLTGTIKIGGSALYMRPRIGQAGGLNYIEQVERSGTAMCPLYN